MPVSARLDNRRNDDPSRVSSTDVFGCTPLVPLTLVLAALTLYLLSSVDAF